MRCMRAAVAGKYMLGIPVVTRCERRQQVHLFCKVSSSVLDVLKCEGGYVRGRVTGLLTSSTVGRLTVPWICAHRMQA